MSHADNDNGTAVQHFKYKEKRSSQMIFVTGLKFCYAFYPPLCNFCETDIESIKHLFCECHVTRTFYLKVKEWCKNFNVNLPQIDALMSCMEFHQTDNIENVLINTLILMYKQRVYQCKDNKINMTITFFKIKVKQLEAIEHKINDDNK